MGFVCRSKIVLSAVARDTKNALRFATGDDSSLCVNSESHELLLPWISPINSLIVWVYAHPGTRNKDECSMNDNAGATDEVSSIVVFLCFGY